MRSRSSRHPWICSGCIPASAGSEVLEAAYLHARSPADARIALYDTEGPEAVEARLPDELKPHAEPVDMQILLATEETEVRPLSEPHEEGENGRQMRVAPALWKIPALGLPLRVAIPFLARREPMSSPPGIRLLSLGARVVTTLVERGDFAPVSKPGILRYVPHWAPDGVRALHSLATLVPGSLTTARFAAPDDPVWAVTPRNLVVSFVGHALDCAAQGREARHEAAERLPRDFWRTEPVPVLEILVPENQLEEGVPWGLQLLLRPIPGCDLLDTLESLHARVGASLFPNALAEEALRRVEQRLESMSDRLPPLRRAKNMTDGRASLTRPELDQTLDHLAMLDAEGFEVRLPGVESMQRLSARVTLVESEGQEKSLRPWFEFQWEIALGERTLTTAEFEKLVDARTPLVFLDRKPVLISPKDREALTGFQKRMSDGGQRLSFFEALRLRLGGASHMHGLTMESMASSPRLDQLVVNLEHARSVEDRTIPEGFVGELRPYQQRGHAWLYYLVDQGFGACLADDMGLGKTVQAIAVILDWRRDETRRRPVLIVCPVSVLGNWRREINRFAPELRVLLHHGKGRARALDGFEKVAAGQDVVLTSYNLLQRDEEVFTTAEFEGVVLDEAQNIKNPNTRQSRAARTLRGNFRLALTGTPLENRPLDLWSIMDFLNEGLLGNRASFLQTLEHPIVKQRSRTRMSALARLVRPFVLRRLKTDPEIISDLPEKTEQVVAATLTREQAILYESVVRKGLEEVERAGEGIQRRGAILTTLLRLKQVCNHPAHYLMDGSALPNRSGKMNLLAEMLEEALDEGDRCLVFTQFKEMGSLLKTHLENQLKQRLLFLHGGVPQKERDDMVARFQEGGEEAPRVFVLSLKAGGTGLNLTSANRVFHYDRWWNPAVEDQATDRAFRIGQERNVFVHKFVCTGTLEERIQQMLDRKREVAENLLAAGEGWITELSNEDLKRLITLDRQEALA